jgi:hypothetical protein
MRPAKRNCAGRYAEAPGAGLGRAASGLRLLQPSYDCVCAAGAGLPKRCGRTRGRTRGTTANAAAREGHGALQKGHPSHSQRLLSAHHTCRHAQLLPAQSRPGVGEGSCWGLRSMRRVTQRRDFRAARRSLSCPRRLNPAATAPPTLLSCAHALAVTSRKVEALTPARTPLALPREAARAHRFASAPCHTTRRTEYAPVTSSSAWFTTRTATLIQPSDQPLHGRPFPVAVARVATRRRPRHGTPSPSPQTLRAVASHPAHTAERSQARQPAHIRPVGPFPSSLQPRPQPSPAAVAECGPQGSCAPEPSA